MNCSKKMFIIMAMSLPALFSACVSKDVPSDTCRISIEAKNYPVNVIGLLWSDGSETRIDSVVLKNGKGTRDIQCQELTQLMLMNFDENTSITIDEGDVIPAPTFKFYAENGKTVTVQFDNKEWPAANISGGKVNNSYMNLWKETGGLQHKRFEIIREMMTAKDSAVKLAKDEELEAVYKKIEETEKQFVKNTPDSYVSMDLLITYLSSTPVLEFESQFLALNDEIRNTEKGKTVYEYVQKLKKTLSGQPAPEFSVKDKDGKIIKLSDFKGKYVLIDFWGTWCMPCRKSNPHLVHLYKEYSPKGIEFINVAHEWGDNPRDGWLKAIEDDGLVWTQILNNEEQQLCNMVELYGVSAFPTKVLIDKDGKIIDKYVGDNESIDEILKKIVN